MQVSRKIVAAAAVATVATLGLATVVSANVLDDTQKKAQETGLADAASLASKATGATGVASKWYAIQGDGALVAIDNNNVGPFQACHNFGSCTGIGGNVPVDDVVGIVGWGNDASTGWATTACSR